MEDSELSFVESSTDELPAPINTESGLIRHAMKELRTIGYSMDNLDKKSDDPNDWAVQNIIDLFRTFSQQGHSGFSAQYVLSVFEKLARFRPLSPLTGDDSEWNQVSDDLWQNNRESAVFKRADGTAYYLDGKVFVETFPDGSKTSFTSKDSVVDITFPYTPATEYVNV